MYLWVLNSETNEFEKVTEWTDIQFYKCLQELALWQGENPLNINDGVNYKGIREGQVFFKQSISNITENYLNYFDEINIGDAYIQGETINIDISFIKENTIYEYTITQG